MRQKLLSTVAAAALVAAALGGGMAPASAQAPRALPTPSGQPQAPSPGGPAPTSSAPAPVQTAPPAPDLRDSATFLPFVYGPLREEGMDAPAANPKGKVHLLPATPATTQWGWFDNGQAPVLHIQSGDTVVMETMMHAHNQIVPGITLDQVKKTRTDYPGRGPHTLTGPIYVEGAEPGDVLRVHINRIVPRAYATNFNLPGLFGEFPKEFPEGQIRFFYLDLDRNRMEFAPGIEIPLRPFPGTTGVARAEPGRYSSVPPGKFAGNLDIRELTEGATLYIPVFVKGALLWSGDSHAGQGNGEVNLCAIETAFKELSLTVDVVKGATLDWPRIETPTDWITVGYDQDLNKALDILRVETKRFIMERDKVADAQAEETMLAGWNCPISEVVNVVKGSYCMLPKNGKAAAPLPEAETAEAFVTSGKAADLNKAMDTASMGMINALVEKKGLTRLDSYALASMTMDCRIVPPRAEEKEVRCMVPKSLWVAQR
jgi:acetamidase/formamidase